MASKTNATPQKEEVPKKEGPETPPDSPLLDLSDAAVKKMIKLAKKRGDVTSAELNAVLPSEQVSTDQIEDVYAMLNEMGINVVDFEEGEQEEEKSARSGRGRGRRRRREQDAGHRQAARQEREIRSRPSAPTTRYVCICARWSVELLSAKARSPSPSGSRPAAR